MQSKSQTCKPRAFRILSAWKAWRAERKLPVELVLEASAFVTTLFVWGVGYTVLCPSDLAYRTVVHAAQVQR